MSLIFLLLLLSSCTFSLLSAADDGAVLLKIKEELGNPDVLSSWVEGFNFCNGSGDVTISVNIVCTGSGRVSGLHIYFASVNSKSFPQAICNLTELKDLGIAYVFGLSGPLPSCINNLVHLENFEMRPNSKFFSPIPEFRNNKNLGWISLSEGGFYGPIPPSLSTLSLPKLETLDLSWNGVTGTIPWELAHNPPLYLDLSNNNMSGELPECATWKNLSWINLSRNRFSGDPSSLFGKENTVNYIDLSYNNFAFDISSIVQVPQNLTYLDLRYNQIYGKVPESLANKPGLYLQL